MRRFCITVVNCALLVVVLVGIPEIAGVQLWDWRISSVPIAQMLLFWGLALVVAGNAFAALFGVHSRKERKLCWEWAAVFAVLLGVEYALAHGWLNFNWLKETLLWLQNHR